MGSSPRPLSKPMPVKDVESVEIESEPKESTVEAVDSVEMRFPPPAPFDASSTTLYFQGAEALLYRTHFLTPSLPAALKVRQPKAYRQRQLDARLRRHRLLSEARVLQRCRRAGISVPALLGLDADAGWLCMEWIEGVVLRQWMTSAKEDETAQVLHSVGASIGAMHAAGVVHGDLTTSNIILRGADVVLIDFGLALQTLQEEERAVDLYVLERALASTHPAAEALLPVIFQAYAASYRAAPAVLRRLDDVRRRGRKRSMLG